MEIYGAGDGGLNDLAKSYPWEDDSKLKELFFPVLKEKNMEIYNAVNEFDGGLASSLLKTVLAAYPYVKKNMKWAHDLNQQFKLFIDSGAFTAYQQGTTINISEYIEFLHEVNPPMIAALDVIGDAEATKENVEIMKATGLDVIPTYHRGSEIKYLEEMIEKFDYIALGGMAGIGTSPELTMSWLKKVWRVIAERKRELKVHGFACTGKKIMEAFPWASVDSTSWLACVMFGRIETPKGIVHPDDWLAETYGNEESNPDFWHDDNALERRQLMLLESVRQVREWEAYLTKKHASYDWDWLTAQGELQF